MCPINIAHHEARSIWQDISNTPPDLVLSIGCGKNIGEGSKTEPTSTSSTHDSLTAPQGPSAVIRQGRGGMGNYKRQGPSQNSNNSGNKGTASGYIVRNNPQAPMLLSFNNPISGQTERLNNDQRLSERTWSRFLATHVAPPSRNNNDNSKNRKNSKSSSASSLRQRYRRICPELISKLPRFDDVSKLNDLEREAQEVLRQNPAELVEIAHRLVASTFFFEKDVSSVKQTASGFTCTGVLSITSFPYFSVPILPV